MGQRTDEELISKDEELISEYGMLTTALIDLAAQRDHISFELQRRMQERGARELLHPNYTCELKPGTPSYDSGRLIPLKELLPPDVIAEGFKPAHEETVKVADKWNGRKLMVWARQFGNDVKGIIEAATIPGIPRLEIKAKEKKEFTQ